MDFCGLSQVTWNRYDDDDDDDDMIISANC